MNISAALLMAPGFEEIEAITCLDLLRRASIPIVSVGLSDGVIMASRETRHIADLAFEEVAEKTWDLLILPGGAEGVVNLRKEDRVRQMVLRHSQQRKWVAAICAAPTLLAEWGLLQDQRFTCHPTVQSTIQASGLELDQRVVVSGHFITSLAAGSSIEFSYEIIRQLRGEESVRQVNRGVCFKESDKI